MSGRSGATTPEILAQGTCVPGYSTRTEKQHCAGDLAVTIIIVTNNCQCDAVVYLGVPPNSQISISVKGGGGTEKYTSQCRHSELAVVGEPSVAFNCRSGQRQGHPASQTPPKPSASETPKPSPTAPAPIRPVTPSPSPTGARACSDLQSYRAWIYKLNGSAGPRKPRGTFNRCPRYPEPRRWALASTSFPVNRAFVSMPHRASPGTSVSTAARATSRLSGRPKQLNADLPAWP